MDWITLWELVEKPVFVIAALALMSGALYGLNYLRTQKHSKLLAQGAALAYGFAERWGEEHLSGKSDKGTAKLRKAMEFLEKFASAYGLKFKADVMTAAIQLAWQKHEGQAKLQSQKGQIQELLKDELKKTVKPH